MAIKVEAEVLSAQISTLNAQFEQQVTPLTLQFSNNKIPFTALLESEMKQLQIGMEGIDSVVKKLATNASDCKEAVIKMDLQLNHEIASAADEIGVISRED